MTGILLAVLIPLAYLAGLVLFARWWYRLKRPFTEPLSCEWSHHRGSYGHIPSCYARNGSLVDSNAMAATCALLLGLAWPFMVAGYASVRCVMTAFSAADRPLPEEVAAKTKRLERELGLEDRPWR